MYDATSGARVTRNSGFPIEYTTGGQTYELGGPRVYTLREITGVVADTLGRRRLILGLPGPLAYLQALILEMLPGKLMTRDNLASMSVDNVCAGTFPADFGFVPTPLEAVLPEYLAPSAARARYSRYRHVAGR